MKKYKRLVLFGYLVLSVSLFAYLGFFSVPSKSTPCWGTYLKQDGTRENADRACTWADSSLDALTGLVYITLPVCVFWAADGLIKRYKK